MCTMISSRHPLNGQAEGTAGWFPIGQVYLAYDHPERVQLEHALLLDFANEDHGPGARVAVERSRDAARDLARQILETVEEADRYEGRSSTVSYGRRLSRRLRPLPHRGTRSA